MSYPFIYTYARHLLPSGAWDVENPDRKDGEGNQIHLASEILTAFPGLMFMVRCDEGEVKVCCEIELDATQQAQLTQVVLDHQANA